MSSEEGRFERGVAMIKKVYAGDVTPAPKGVLDFSDLMLEQLFAEIWTREDKLAVRDRRLVIMGVIACMGEKDTFKIQAKAALKNGEISAVELRDILITLAQYAGYPRAAGLLGAVESAIAEVAKEQAEV